ncbi:hypothetical protein ACRRTK_000781 [Alexandromys fortis]
MRMGPRCTALFYRPLCLAPRGGNVEGRGLDSGANSRVSLAPCHSSLSLRLVGWHPWDLRQPLSSPLGCPRVGPASRKDKKNHTNKLRELALLIPVTMSIRNKKHTKKEILLRVLHYIHYLQRCIDMVQALLKLHNSDSKGGFVGLESLVWEENDVQDGEWALICPLLHSQGWVGTHLPAQPSRHSTPSSYQKSHLWGTCSRPRKKFTRVSGDYGAGTQDGELDTDIKAQSRDQRSCFLTRAEPYLSLFSSIEGFSTTDRDCISGADPSPLASESSQSNTWHGTNYLSEILGLSSSLFSSPSKILPDHVLEDETYFLTEGLMEPLPAACELEDPQEKVQDTPTAPPNFQSSVSLDHCYLPLSENTKVLSSCSSSSESTDTESLSGQEVRGVAIHPGRTGVFSLAQSSVLQQANPVGVQTPSDEDRDDTWTPTRQSSGLPVAGKKTKKVQASQGSGKLKESRKACPGQVKKKCVNGFIMFCRMNRKHYIRACPGTASTAATKDLAQLWREMTLEERRPYCTKARRFSRQHNRIVKRESSSSEDDDGETPKPFYQLLADRAQVPWALALLPSPHCQ